ncbi:MAG: ester cyclase [Candidatus Kariarchaeaceae archaeon]|jgi:predicted ester cyclase
MDNTDLKTRNEEIAKLWFEVMWSHPDLELADKLIDENYDPDWVHIEKTGAAQVKHEITYFRSAFSDLKYSIVDLIGQEDRVWVRYKASAVHSGNAWGFEPTGKPLDFEGAAILYINADGKIVDRWGAFCLYDLLAELDLVPPFWELSKHFMKQ